ncbi:LPS export ABC transporter periplasmic protein LptC [Rhizobium sp. KVB221]|uniref:LPS export ABC transporter periplasmic protein LptC n=1 Tax=Rhizobium setariae TaxID=2801340 RepID=A0A936YK34_9HYPH|nr:LPS export ABC transporter periplasmic protein LptC [Rhizobium setariae]MBL0371819.1 LPS export ABC transporter periplasmic protein LptC [Rhizobium setariae]
MDIRASTIIPATGAATAYSRALSHSARVRRLKILLPIAALVISLCFVAVSWVRTIFPDNLSIGGAKIENGKVVMEKPAISGRNEDGISYFMNARRALQDIINPNAITLEDIEAAVPIRGDLVARVKAQAADFDRSTDKLHLTKPFVVTLSSGVVVDFQSARLDVHAGRLETLQPVAVKAKDSTLVAKSLKITDKGRVILFEGDVLVTINPAAYRTKENQGQATP